MTADTVATVAGFLLFLAAVAGLAHIPAIVRMYRDSR